MSGDSRLKQFICLLFSFFFLYGRDWSGGESCRLGGGGTVELSCSFLFIWFLFLFNFWFLCLLFLFFFPCREVGRELSARDSWIFFFHVFYFILLFSPSYMGGWWENCRLGGLGQLNFRFLLSSFPLFSFLLLIFFFLYGQEVELSALWWWDSWIFYSISLIFFSSLGEEVGRELSALWWWDSWMECIGSPPLPDHPANSIQFPPTFTLDGIFRSSKKFCLIFTHGRIWNLENWMEFPDPPENSIQFPPLYKPSNQFPQVFLRFHNAFDPKCIQPGNISDNLMWNLFQNSKNIPICCKI